MVGGVLGVGGMELGMMGELVVGIENLALASFIDVRVAISSS